MDKILIVTGILYFVFRFWITEYWLPDELGFKRFYISRIINLYFAMALVLNLENMIFNIIIFASAPIVLVTMFWDSKFYYECARGDACISKRWWQMAERITLHLPIVLTGLLFVINGAAKYVNAGQGYLPLVYALLFILLPYFLLDERWKARYLWPQGLLILFLVFATVSATAVFMQSTQ